MTTDSTPSEWAMECAREVCDVYGIFSAEKTIAAATLIDRSLKLEREEQRERDAAILKAKADEYEAEWNAPASAANSFCEMTMDTPAGYATYHAFKTLLPNLEVAIRNQKEGQQ